MDNGAKNEVIMETTAVLDSYGIIDYITTVLLAAESAQRVYSLSENQVLSLAPMPAHAYLL